MPPLHLLYGLPPSGLIEVPRDAVQTSPVVPGAQLLERIAPAGTQSMTLIAPAGTIERRYALALALRVLAPGGMLVALGAKDKGGARLRRELEQFGCAVAEESRRHWRICTTRRPDDLPGLDVVLAEGAPRIDPATGLWTQPGIFSWNEMDEGTALLLAHLPADLAGRGADLGCGLGLLSRAALTSPAVERIDALDVDGRAIDAARANVRDSRVHFHWRDVREPLPVAQLDFVLMNPPFHAGGREDVALGRVFLRQARSLLRPDGVLWLVANRHLPYEAELDVLFAKVKLVAQSNRFKIYCARA